MREALHEFTHHDGDAELLLQLAAEAILESFTRLTLSAGKFPQAREVAAGEALRDEKLVAAEDEAGGDLNGFANCELRIANSSS